MTCSRDRLLLPGITDEWLCGFVPDSIVAVPSSTPSVSLMYFKSNYCLHVHGEGRSDGATLTEHDAAGETSDREYLLGNQ